MDYVSRTEFNLFRDTVEHNTEKIEKNLTQIHELAASVRELAASVRTIAENQKRLGDKIESLQSKDGEMWRKLISYIVTAIAGAVVMQAFQRLG